MTAVVTPEACAAHKQLSTSEASPSYDSSDQLVASPRHTVAVAHRADILSTALAHRGLKSVHH